MLENNFPAICSRKNTFQVFNTSKLIPLLPEFLMNKCRRVLEADFKRNNILFFYAIVIL